MWRHFPTILLSILLVDLRMKCAVIVACGLQKQMPSARTGTNGICNMLNDSELSQIILEVRGDLVVEVNGVLAEYVVLGAGVGEVVNGDVVFHAFADEAQ